MNETMNLEQDEQDFLDSFAPQTQPTDVPEETKPAEAEVAETTPEETPGETKPEDKPKTKPTKEEQQAYAFAQLRTENTSYKQALKDMATVLGVKESEGLLETLKEKALEVMSQKQNIPVDVLKDLEYLKQRDAEFTRMQLQQAAVMGFQKIKEEFKLDDSGLKEFAESLQADGINPFAQSVDLKREYVTRNYDRLLAEATEKGKQEEAQRAAKANKQSTTINKLIGGEDGEVKKINGVSELTNFLNTL